MLIALLLVVTGLGAQSAHDPGFKLGLVAGYPSGVSIAYRFDKDFEINGLVGTNYFGVAAGLDGMFRVTDIVIANEVFPFSIGPGVYIGTGWFSGVDLSALFKAHAEYSFRRAPFNLFLEAGAGIKFDAGNSFNVSFGWTGAFGARFVFGHPSLK